jgi:hypothetical protein
MLGTPLCTRGAWAAYLWAGQTPAHTCHLGCRVLAEPQMRTRGAWTVPRPNYTWVPHAVEPHIALDHWLYRTQNRFGFFLCRTQIALNHASVIFDKQIWQTNKFNIHIFSLGLTQKYYTTLLNQDLTVVGPVATSPLPKAELAPAATKIQQLWPCPAPWPNTN